MAFTNPPVWNNKGAEPPETLKNSGFSAGYKPPAGYFNWFWNKVSVCLKELQEAVGKSGSTVVKDITIPTTGWLVHTDSLYKLTVADTEITPDEVVTLNLNLESSAVAEECGLRGVTESVEGGFCIYAEAVPLSAMEGTLVIQKGVS